MSSSTILIGRLVKDIEVKKATNGTEYGLIRLAVRRNYKPKDGEAITDFFNIPVFNKGSILNLMEYTQKGSLLAVHGQLQTNTVMENNEQKTYINIWANQFEFLSNPRKHPDTEDKITREIDIEGKDLTQNVQEEIQNEIANINFDSDQLSFNTQE